MSEVEAGSRKTVEERDKMEQCLQTALKEKAVLERKCTQLNGRLNKISADLKEEKEVGTELSQEPVITSLFAVSGCLLAVTVSATAVTLSLPL